MISRYNFHDLLWIDVESPTHEEVRALMEEFDIHPIVADELLGPSLRPKVDHYENFIYLILHFPAIHHSHTSSRNQEVDFIIGKKYLITVHYEMIDPLHKFSKVFEVNSILDRSNIGEHAGFLFFYMIRKIYASLIHELAAIGDILKEVEDKIFKGEERKMVEQLSSTHRDLLAFQRAMRMHKSVLQSLIVACDEFFGKEFRHYIENIVGEYYKVEEMLDDQKAVLSELRETNNSLLTTKTNEVIKALTVINISILPAGLIAGLFAMDTDNNPTHNFWFILLLMSIVASLSLLFFKQKKWF